MAFVAVNARGARSFRQRMAPNEYFVLLGRKHWAAIAEPVATGVLSFFLFMGVIWQNERQHGEDLGFLMVLWLFIAGRSVFHFVEWWFGWFGSTQRRLVLQTGIIVHKFAMMPLEKVTDMNYTRSPMGQLLGYGQLVMESAGQDQALREVRFVRHPDQTYLVLISTMFGPKDAPPAPAPEPEVEDDDEEDLDGLRVYSIDEWEAMSAASDDEMPPSFQPRAHGVRSSARPGKAPTGETDVDTQVIDRTDEVALKRAVRPEPDYRLVTDPGDD